MRLLSISEVAEELRGAIGTLRRWHRQGRLAPVGRAVSGHRRYRNDFEAVVLDAMAVVPREQEQTEDLVEILTVFSSRLYGPRTTGNLQAVASCCRRQRKPG